jgi:hypothetical protein
MGRGSIIGDNRRRGGDNRLRDRDYRGARSGRIQGAAGADTGAHFG